MWGEGQSESERVRHASPLLSQFLTHVQKFPKRSVCDRVTVKQGQFNDAPLTYEELALRMRRYASVFQKEYGLKHEDRIILCVSDPHEFLSCTLAAMWGGFVIVPLPTFSDFGVPVEFLRRIELVRADCEPGLILIENRALWNRHMKSVNFTTPVVEVSEIRNQALDRPEGVFEIEEGNPVETAFIQYTSGSTGHPKGVVITHANLVANIEAMGRASEINPESDRLLSWLPLYHDMGLVGSLLFTLYWRIPAYILSPLAFVSRPLDWLRGIQHYKITYSVGPTFAYHILVKKIPERDLLGLDLSSWRLAFIGAEPIDVDTAVGFASRFEKYGFAKTSFYPVYGMAEATLALAFPKTEAETRLDCVDRLKLVQEQRAVPVESGHPNAIVFVSVGNVLPEHTLEIWSPDGDQVLPDRSVGEIVATGPSISPYYFNKNTESQTRRRELRTGDLGYLAEGELFVMDRLKDIIIIAGQNFYPSDIEKSLRAVQGLRIGRVVAYSTHTGSGTDQLSIAAEVDPSSWRSHRVIRQEVIDQVAKHFGLKVEKVTLMAPGSIPKTSSGKVKRRACRDLVMEPIFSIHLSWRTILLYKWRFFTRKVLALLTSLIC